MVTLHEVITFLVSMQISISSLQTHNVNRCGRSRHLARKLSLRRKRSSPNVFEMAATETITSIILIKLIRVSLGTVRHPRRFKIVVIDIQITLKQMLRDFIGIRVNRAKKSGMVNITSSVNSRERSGINTILHELNPLFTINVTMRDIKSKNVYSRVTNLASHFFDLVIGKILTSRLSLSKHLAHNLGNLLLLGKIGVFHNRRNASSIFLSLILHLGNLFLIVQLHFSKLFLILKSGVNHTSRGSISTSTLPSIKLRKCSSKIITSILSFISGRLATKSNQIKQLIRNGRSASLQRTFKKSFTSFSHSTRNKTRDGLIRVRNIRALNGRFNTSITHAYSIVIGSKHITLNATGGGFLTASKQFRHGATSKSRSNTASNSTKHKSPHLSGWRQIISLIT